MAYCVQCGKQIGESDKFCPGCGTSQQRGAPGSHANFWNNLTDRQTATLCYLPWVGWIASVAVLASDRFRGDKRVQFHAFQGLYLFVAWLMIEWFLSPAFHFTWGIHTLSAIPRLLHLALFVAWIVMLIKVNQGIDFRLPLLGELADRSVAEQRS